MATVTGKIDFDGMLQNIPAGQERERAAVSLDRFLGIQHIPTEGFGSSVQSSGSNMQVDNSVASWISPDGEFIGTHGSHTSTVMENPEQFGLSREEADNLFSNGEEESIITFLLDAGWIRIRNQFNFILISVGRVDSSVKERLMDWSASISKPASCPIVLDDSSRGETHRLYLRNLREGIFSGKRFNLEGQVKDEHALWSVLKSSKSQALFSDLKNKIMKWTAQDPNNKKAYQQAMQLFRENFGKNPQSEKDAKVIMKTAQQMAKTGQVYSDESFKQVAQQVMAEGGGSGQQQSQQQSQQQQGQSSGGVNSQDPVALFKAIQALYKEGSITKEQVEKAFRMVTGGQAQQGQQAYNMPDQTQQDDQQEPLAASFKPIKSSGKNPGVVFDRLPKGVTGFQIGSRVIYNPMNISSSLPVAVEDEDASYAGKEGVITAINNELYNVEMPEDGEIVSAYGDELERVVSEEEILSARGIIADPMREYAQQFLSNVPSFTKVPENYKDARIVKEKLAPDHVCYWYSETIDNGKSYTVEFHVSPGDPFADVYVVRNFDNTPLDHGGYHIEDFEDWNLSEVDYVEGLFAKEKASAGKEASFDKDKRGITPYGAGADHVVAAGFSQWSARVAAGLSLGKGLSLPDMVIVSGLARVLSSNISSGFTEGYNKTLDTVYKLTHSPLEVIDDVASLPFKFLDKVTGRGKVKSGRPRLGFKKPITSTGNGRSDESYTHLYSGEINAIFSMAGVILSALSNNVKVWLDGLTKQVQQKYPDAYVGASTVDKTWVVFDGGKLQGGGDNLLFSVGVLPSGEYGYVFRSGGKLLNGKTKELAELKQLLLNLEG